MDRVLNNRSYVRADVRERVLAAIAETGYVSGFEFVEFWGWTDKDLDAVKAAAEKAEIGISGFNGDAELSLIDPSQKECQPLFAF